MQVKQCRCGGAMIEVSSQHEGPILCGAPLCGESRHRAGLRELRDISRAWEARGAFMMRRTCSRLPNPHPRYACTNPVDCPNPDRTGEVYIAGPPRYVGRLPSPPFEIITRETQPVFSKKDLEADLDQLDLVVKVGLGVASPVDSKQRHAASLKKECDMATINGVRRELIIDIVKRKLEEGRADFLADLSLEFIAGRRSELVMAPPPKNTTIQDEAIPLILRTLEGDPTHRAKFEKLASAYKELLKYEEAACPKESLSTT